MRRVALLFMEILAAAAAIVAMGAMYVSPTGIFVATPVERVKLLWFSMIIGGIVWMLIRKAEKLTWEKKSGQRTRLIAIVMVLTVILQTIIAFTSYDGVWGWDCQAVVLWNSATQAEAEYFLRYPNNIMTTYILKLAELLGTAMKIDDVWLSAILANVLFVDGAMIVLFCLARDYFSAGAFLLTILFGISMIALSPEILIPYSDTIGMVFPILIVYLTLKIRDERQKVKLCAEALCLGIASYLGYLIKPTAVIAWIAIVLCTILFFSFAKMPRVCFGNLKRVLVVCMLFAVGVLLIFGVNINAQNAILGEYNKNELKDRYEFPMAHFLMMGLKDSNGFYGSWNNEDYQATLEIEGKTQKSSHSLAVAKERISEMGVSKFLIHLVKKYVFVMSDGTFFYGAEGDDRGEPEGTGLKYGIQNLTHPGTSAYKAWYAQILHSLWFIVLAGIAVFSVKQIGAEENNRNGILMQIITIGIIAFTLLFEGRSRYLYMFLPFFIMTAAIGFDLDDTKSEMR